MKSGKRPSRNQRKAIYAAGLDPRNWLVVKNQTDQMLLSHRETGATKTILNTGGN